MTFVALPWFVLVTTGSPTKMNLVLAAEILPMALFGIPSGSLVAPARRAHDDAPLGRGARTADRARAAAPLDGPSLVRVLLVIVFLLGVFTAPYVSVAAMIIPELFGDDDDSSRKRRPCSAARRSCRS